MTNEELERMADRCAETWYGTRAALGDVPFHGAQKLVRAIYHNALKELRAAAKIDVQGLVEALEMVLKTGCLDCASTEYATAALAKHHGVG